MMNELFERYALYVHFYLQTGDVSHLEKANEIKNTITAAS